MYCSRKRKINIVNAELKVKPPGAYGRHHGIQNQFKPKTQSPAVMPAPVYVQPIVNKPDQRGSQKSPKRQKGFFTGIKIKITKKSYMKTSVQQPKNRH